MEITTDMRRVITISLIMAVVIGGLYWFTSRYEIINQPPVQQGENVGNTNMENELTKEIMKATIKTDKGGIVLDLYPKAAPKTVENFITKAKSGYFDGLKFHRVEDWVIQGGDPLSGDPAKEQLWGTGGGDITTELSDLPFVAGTLGVARGQDINISNDSQFFIVKKDSQFLDNKYTLFGQVVFGMDIVNQIEKGDKIVSVVIE